MTARLIHTAPGPVFRLRRLVRIARIRFYRWCLECLRDERETYTTARMAGPVYLLNSWNQELQLRARIRKLEAQA